MVVVVEPRPEDLQDAEDAEEFAAMEPGDGNRRWKRADLEVKSSECRDSGLAGNWGRSYSPICVELLSSRGAGLVVGGGTGEPGIWRIRRRENMVDPTIGLIWKVGMGACNSMCRFKYLKKANGRILVLARS